MFLHTYIKSCFVLIVLVAFLLQFHRKSKLRDPEISVLSFEDPENFYFSTIWLINFQFRLVLTIGTSSFERKYRELR